jgi:hypothetical protein
MDEARVYYVHMRTAAAGAVTFALRLAGRVGSWQLVHVGMAFCAARDQFSAARGRLVATGRLQRRAVTVAVPWVDAGTQEVLQGACRRAAEQAVGIATDPTVCVDEARLPRWLPAWWGAWQLMEAQVAHEVSC